MKTDPIARIRAFNRFYTREIGLLRRRFLESRFSLVQARVLFELHSRPGVLARDLGLDLGLDPAYLSKILKKFEQDTLITRTCSPQDSRKYLVSLSEQGEKTCETLRAMSNRQIGGLIENLTDEEQDRLTAAMDTIETVLGTDGQPSPYYLIRSHRPGDMGYVIHRHGVLYAREYGFNDQFDAYVAKGMGRFLENRDPDREHLWIAEAGNRIIGSVAIVRAGDDTAQLRWLFVEPSDRGRGIAGQLVREAVAFARHKGYARVMLWTIDFLRAARHLYAKAGFSLTDTKLSRAWGRELTEEKWELPLMSSGRYSSS